MAIAESFQAQPSSHQIRLPQDSEYTLIVSAKMNDIDPQAWMADVLARLPNITVSRVHELLPWHWKAKVEAIKAA